MKSLGKKMTDRRMMHKLVSKKIDKMTKSGLTGESTIVKLRTKMKGRQMMDKKW